MVTFVQPSRISFIPRHSASTDFLRYLAIEGGETFGEAKLGSPTCRKRDMSQHRSGSDGAFRGRSGSPVCSPLTQPGVPRTWGSSPSPSPPSPRVHPGRGPILGKPCWPCWIVGGGFHLASARVTQHFLVGFDLPNPVQADVGAHRVCSQQD